MTSYARYIRQLRLAAGFRTASAAARAMGVPVATYTQHEGGQRAMEAGVWVAYMAFFQAVAAAPDVAPRLSHEMLAASMYEQIQAPFLLIDWPRFCAEHPAESETYRRQIDRLFHLRDWPLPAARRPSGVSHAS